MNKRLTIAIDGPAASGKSTSARLLAQKLGYIYIDSGAMYRAATLAVLEHKINIYDEKAVARCLNQVHITIKNREGEQHTYLDGRDVNDLIRGPQINDVISIISSYPSVRKGLLKQQQQLAENGGVVMDGRDIGTVVLPNADLKVFMIASLEERARRRQDELQKKGLILSLEEVKAEINNRDLLDSCRDTAPLKKAADARELDNSNLSIAEQVRIIEGWAREILSKP